MKKSLLLTILFLVVSLPCHANTFKIERWQTPNGATVVFYEAKEVPMLDISIAFAAGSAYDNQAFGLAAITGQLLSQGSGTLNTDQIAEKLADIGAQFDVDTSRDMTALQLKTLTSPEALQQAVDTFSLILSKPVFKQDAFNRVKNQQLMAISHALESPEDVANMLFFNKLYQNHPYAHPVNGTLDSVKKINAWQVRDFYKKYFVSSNAVIVLVGAIDKNKAQEIALEITKNLPQGKAANPIPKATPLGAGTQVNVDFPSSQTFIRLGQLGINHHNPDYFPLLVGNYILGGGPLVSLLPKEVRGKQGLTYGIGSQFMPMPGEGPFLISLSTENSRTDLALKTTKEVLNGFLKSGPSQEDLVAAKQFLTGSFPLSLASNSNIGSMLLKMAFYHLPEDYLVTYTAHIEAVTQEAIKSAFSKLIRPEQMLLIIVGKTHETNR